MLSITDHFTKYVKAIPLPNQTAETIADAFVRGWVAVFGAPHMLHTDQGRNFDSELIAEVCKMLTSIRHALQLTTQLATALLNATIAVSWT